MARRRFAPHKKGASDGNENRRPQGAEKHHKRASIHWSGGHHGGSCLRRRSQVGVWWRGLVVGASTRSTLKVGDHAFRFALLQEESPDEEDATQKAPTLAPYRADSPVVWE